MKVGMLSGLTVATNAEDKDARQAVANNHTTGRVLPRCGLHQVMGFYGSSSNKDSHALPKTRRQQQYQDHTGGMGRGERPTTLPTTLSWYANRHSDVT